jgi:hypothetical protein
MYRAAFSLLVGVLGFLWSPVWATAAPVGTDSAGIAQSGGTTGYGAGSTGTSGADDEEDKTTTTPQPRPQPPKPPPPPPPPKRCAIVPQPDRTCLSGWRNYEACYVNGVLISATPKTCMPATRGSTGSGTSGTTTP